MCQSLSMIDHQGKFYPALAHLKKTVQLWIDESNIFSISKHFDENLTLPLVSVMFANNVTLPINGTSIFCTEYQNLDSNLEVWITETLSTTLHIIESGAPNYGRL